MADSFHVISIKYDPHRAPPPTLLYPPLCNFNIPVRNSLPLHRVASVLQNGKILGPKRFAPPPPPHQYRVKLFVPPPPPFKGWTLFCAPSPSVWLKLQATMHKLPQNILCPLFSMAKTCSPPLHLPPPPHIL